MGKRDRARAAEAKEENINVLENKVWEFLTEKGLLIKSGRYVNRIGKYSSEKCVEKLTSSLNQVMSDPNRENLSRLEQIMTKAGFDETLMQEFIDYFSIVVKDEPSREAEESDSTTVLVEEPEVRFDMPDINDILNSQEKNKTDVEEPAPKATEETKKEDKAPEEQEAPRDEVAAVDQPEPKKDEEPVVSDDGKPQEDTDLEQKAKEAANKVENPEMPIEQALTAFLQFNRVDLSKFGGKEEQNQIIAELSEAIKACQKELNPASMKMLGEVVIGKMGMDKEVIERLGNVFIPNWREQVRPKGDPDKDLAIIKDEARKLNDEIEELKRQIAERKQKLGELGEKIEDAEAPEIEPEQETIGQKADRAMKKHEALTTEKSFLSGIETIQRKTLDFYTDHMITGSYDGVKFVLAESVALAAMTGYTIGKVTLKLGKMAGKAIFKAAKGTAEKAKEKADAKREAKKEEKSEVEEPEKKDEEKSDSDEPAKKDEEKSRVDEPAKKASKKSKEKPAPKKSARQIRKEEKERADDEQAIDVIELGKETSLQLLTLSRERLEQARVKDSLFNNPSKEADLDLMRAGTDEERATIRSMLSRENEDLIVKAMKNINTLRYETLCRTLEKSCGLNREEVLELIKTAKVNNKGEVVLGKKSTFSLKDIDEAGAGRLFRDAVSIDGIGTLKQEEVLRLARGIKVQNGKISVDGIESLSKNGRLLAASISGNECYFDGAENVAKIISSCMENYDLNNRIIDESYAIDLYHVCVDLDCQIEMIRSEMIDLQAKGIKKSKDDKERREELRLIADDKVAKLEDLGIIEVIETERSYSSKLSKEASRVLTPDLVNDVKESADLGREFIGPEEEQESEK